MSYIYLVKYQVNYTDETKYKVFCIFIDANNLVSVPMLSIIFKFVLKL